MFLPVLLVRDFGIRGWIVFTIPNVVGAAAMGFVLRSRDASTHMVAQHLPAMGVFSAVTIAFHAYFFGMFTAVRVDSIAGMLAVLIGLSGIVWLLSRKRGADLAITAVIWLASVGLAAAVMRLRLDLVDFVPFAPRVLSSAWDLFGLVCVCALGFLACPYLDLTFHRARQHTTATGAKLAFGVGFGVFFLAMIGFTLVYTTDPRVYTAADDPLVTRLLGPTIMSLITLHLVMQGGATAGLHLREIGQRSRFWAGVVVVVVIPLLPAAALIGGTYAGLSVAEIGYRLFMACYGLLFPAYVWMVMMRERGWVWLVPVVVLAAPFYWIGFIERQAVWLLGGVMIVVIGGFAPRRALPTAKAAGAT